MSTLRIILLITVIVALNYELCFCRCPRAEYEIDGRCCPMCAPGNRVYWSCTDDTSTTCVPCSEFTYTDEPNGLSKCFPCSECYSDEGLRVSKACTRWSDTVCEPLESFFCTDRNKDGCRRARQHSECRAGQYIKHAGTGSTDTVCADCKADTYSNGSFSSCKPHTKCGALGLTEVNPGTQSSDTECRNPSTAAIVIVLSVLALIIIIIVVSLITIIHIQRKKRSRQSGIQEKGNDVNENGSVVVDDRINAELLGLEQIPEQLGITAVSRRIRIVFTSGLVPNPTQHQTSHC